MTYFETKSSLTLGSLYKIVLSFEPEPRIWLDQANDPTLAEWPPNVVNFLILYESYIWTSPYDVPIDNWFPLGDQATLVTISLIPKTVIY